MAADEKCGFSFIFRIRIPFHSNKNWTHVFFKVYIVKIERLPANFPVAIKNSFKCRFDGLCFRMHVWVFVSVWARARDLLTITFGRLASIELTFSFTVRRYFQNENNNNKVEYGV